MRNIIEIEDKHGTKLKVWDNDAIGKTIQKTGQWEPDFMAFIKTFVKPGDVCIDIGANFGYNTVAMYKESAAVVHAFEPNKDMYDLLVTNVTDNVHGSVGRYCYNMAVGNEYKKVAMEKYNPNDNWVNYGTYSISDGDEIQMVKLDDFELGQISVIKIDAQGSELDIIKGAEQLLLLNRPTLFIELEEPQLQKFGTTPEAVSEYLINLGYQVFKTQHEPFTNHIAIYTL